MNEQDQNLIQSVNNSDPKAFKTIFEQHWQLIYRLALQKLPSDDDANDITQEVFYLIWKNRENWHVKTNTQAYLKAMLKHKIYDFYALRHRLPVIIPLDTVEDYWEKMCSICEIVCLIGIVDRKMVPVRMDYCFRSICMGNDGLLMSHGFSAIISLFMDMLCLAYLKAGITVKYLKLGDLQKLKF